MQPHKQKNVLRRVATALTLSVSLIAVERAEAACTPPTSDAAPASNTTVTCSGATADQNGSTTGYGTGNESGVTINVQTGASLISTSTLPSATGILIADGTVNNLGTITVAGGNGTGILGGNGITVNNSGLINADGTGHGDRGILTRRDAHVVNTGSIFGNHTAIQADGTATVSNGGFITGAAFAINAQSVKVTDNSGSIEAVGADGVAINATADATVNNTGGSIRALNTGGTAIKGQTINIIGNSGLIEGAAANTVAVDAAGDAIVNNSGKILATNVNGIAVRAGGTATVTNTGDGVTTGLISGTKFGITADMVSVTANSGTIEATSVSGFAINAVGTVTVNNNSGIIQGNAAGGTGINGGTVTVTNNTGTISGAFNGIGGGTAIDVTGNAGLITGIQGIVAVSGVVTVGNLSGGTVSGTSRGIVGRTVSVTGNDGVIEATGANGVAIQATDTVTVANGTGTIRANNNNADARAIVGDIVNITANAGKIEATNTGGIAITAGSAKVINNTGGTITGGDLGIRAGTIDITNAAGATISGGNIGIQASGIITNAGTISGGTASVAFTGTGTNTLILKNSAVLIGDAVGNVGATNKLILQGAGTTNNNFRNFNSLDVQDALWNLNGNSDVGTATILGGASLLIGEDASHANARLTGNVAVNSGATLGGSGTVDGNVNVLGTLHPGYLTLTGTTLTVTGNVNFDANATFRVNANGDGTADKLAVGQVATLNGSVRVLAGGSFQPTTRYTILTAAAGLGGTTFGSFSTDLAFLTPTLTYDANNVFLTLTNGGGVGGSRLGFASVAQSPNQRVVATALDGGATSNRLVTAVLNQSVDGARQAFDALSGEIYGSVHNAQAEEAQFARGAMLSRMRQASYAGAPGELGALGFAGPQLAYASGASAQASAYPVKAPAYGPARDLTFWALGLGGWGRSDGDGNAASFSSRFGGFLSGVDARFGESWRAGLVAGYVRSDLHADARASSAGIDSVQLGAYATGRFGAFNVRGGGSYSLDDIDTSRGVAFPGFTDQTKARLHGNVGQVFGEVGYGMALGNVALEPFAGLAYVHLRNGSFLESGGAAALSGSATHENIGYTSLGLRLASIMPLANGTVLVPRATFAWQYAFGDVTPTAALAFQGTGTAFSVAGVPIAQNSALVDAGLDWRFSPQAKIGVSYLGELAAHAQTHAIKGAFTWDF
jgi:outer membrane autotransporter protein